MNEKKLYKATGIVITFCVVTLFASLVLFSLALYRLGAVALSFGILGLGVVFQLRIVYTEDDTLPVLFSNIGTVIFLIAVINIVAARM